MEITSGFAYTIEMSSLDIICICDGLALTHLWYHSSPVEVTSTWQIQFKSWCYTFYIFVFITVTMKMPFLSAPILQMIITTLLEKLQEKIWQDANKQAPSRKKNCVCCSDLMNETLITKIGDGSVREGKRGHSWQKRSFSLHSWCRSLSVWLPYQCRADG